MTIEFHKIVEGDWGLYLGDGGEGEIRFDVFKDGDGATRDVVIANIAYGTAHALADWIIANVPKPAPTPLPTQFGAVVKSDGQLYTLAALDVHIGGCRWIGADPIYGDWTAETTLQEQGFEVIFEGVDE